MSDSICFGHTWSRRLKDVYCLVKLFIYLYSYIVGKYISYHRFYGLAVKLKILWESRKAFAISNNMMSLCLFKVWKTAIKEKLDD